MLPALFPYGPCNGCAFYRQHCQFGYVAPSPDCADFAPLCHICTYPALFCVTCPLRHHNEHKPYSGMLLSHAGHRYICVW